MRQFHSSEKLDTDIFSHPCLITGFVNGYCGNLRLSAHRHSYYVTRLSRDTMCRNRYRWWRHHYSYSPLPWPLFTMLIAHCSNECIYFSFQHTDQRGSHSLLETRSEEHTSELQSRPHLVCRLLLEKKKTNPDRTQPVSRNHHDAPHAVLVAYSVE